MPPGLPIYITNTYGQRREEFVPLEPGKVKMYTCGPTVYSYVHIGNIRSFVMADILRRVFEYNGYDVTHVRNITDVGHLTNETLNTGIDRIERAAKAENKTPWDIARFFGEVFEQDAAKVNLLPPMHTPRATEFIEPMIELADRIVDLGYGYSVDGNVYFDVAKFTKYGALSGNNVPDLIEEHRVEMGAGKRSPADFALWKAAAQDKIMRWPSPWGEGVPGWHLECSAMVFRLLGEQIDIHTGGIDNIFPHHEDEIAQSEAASGAQFVRYWVHGAFLQIQDGQKMAKSSGNFYTVSDLENMGIHPLAYRYFTFQANYRTPLSLNYDALQGAQTALVRLWETAAELYQQGATPDRTDESEGFRIRFHECINNDLDMPRAVAIAHEAAGAKLTPGEKRWLFDDFDRILGLDLLAMGKAFSKVTPQEEALLSERSAARETKDWSTSDRLRDALRELGLSVRDSSQGQRWARTDVLPAGSGDGHP